MDATETTVYEWSWEGLVPLLIVLALVLVPFWKIWRRTGHSGGWALLMLVPVANIISLWVLAFKKWPAVSDGRSG